MSQRDVKNRIVVGQEHPARSRARWRWSPPRACAVPSSASRALRPYAGAIRRMTRQAAEAAGAELGALPILQEHERSTRSRSCWSPATAASPARSTRRSSAPACGPPPSTRREGRSVIFYASGRRGVSSLTFRGREVAGSYTGFTDRPAYGDAREIAEELMAAYVDGEVDRVEVFYNGYVSPLTQEVRRETLLPLQQATILERARRTTATTGDERRTRRRPARARRVRARPRGDPRSAWSRTTSRSRSSARCSSRTASEHGARMTAMRSASDNAGEIIEDLTLEMNRARQAEITQEIMEVVAGAESLT